MSLGSIPEISSVLFRKLNHIQPFKETPPFSADDPYAAGSTHPPGFRNLYLTLFGNFPQNRGPFWGVPVVRIIAYWPKFGSHCLWKPLFLRRVAAEAGGRQHHLHCTGCLGWLGFRLSRNHAFSVGLNPIR